MALDFAARLTRLREDAGLSQADMARAISVSRSTISRVEQGETVPGWDLVEAWARACGRVPQIVFRTPGAATSLASDDDFMDTLPLLAADPVLRRRVKVAISILRRAGTEGEGMLALLLDGWRRATHTEAGRSARRLHDLTDTFYRIDPNQLPKLLREHITNLCRRADDHIALAEEGLHNEALWVDEATRIAKTMRSALATALAATGTEDDLRTSVYGWSEEPGSPDAHAMEEEARRLRGEELK